MPTAGISALAKMEQTGRSNHVAIETAASGKPSFDWSEDCYWIRLSKQTSESRRTRCLFGADETAATRRLVGIMNHLKFQNKFMRFQGKCCRPGVLRLSLDKFSCRQRVPSSRTGCRSRSHHRRTIQLKWLQRLPSLRKWFLLKQLVTQVRMPWTPSLPSFANFPRWISWPCSLKHDLHQNGWTFKMMHLNRNIQFGVREFAMGNDLWTGWPFHGGLPVYGGNFLLLVFSDSHVKAAVRLSALQGLPVTYAPPRFNRGWWRWPNAINQLNT